MRKFNKNIAKEFKTSFGRFIAIMAIIALGVGFLIGVTQATPDMKNTMDHYLVENEAYDVDVKGTFGLTQADIDAIRGLKDDAGNEIVESVTPVISTDAVVTAGEYETRSPSSKGNGRRRRAKSSWRSRPTISRN